MSALTQKAFPVGWNQSYTGNAVHVGVVGSGVDRSDPALFGHVASLKSYEEDNGRVTQATTVVDDTIGHDTQVALAIAAQPVFGHEPGLAPGVQIEARQISTLESGINFSLAGGLAAIQDLISNKVLIINNSWNATASDPAPAYADYLSSYQAVAAQYKNFTDQGALIIQSSGNESASIPGAISRLPLIESDIRKGFITVGAVMPDDTLASFSNACGDTQQWCLVAPASTSGYTINGINQDGSPHYGLALFTGTSAAAPTVTALAAVLKEKYPWMTNNNLRLTILTTAQDLGAPGVDSTFGWGRVDGAKAVNGPAQFAFGDVMAAVTPGHYTWSNDISGAGGLYKTQDGTLELSGQNTYTGATTILGGTLEVNGSVSSDTLVAPGGTLSGTGRTGNVTNEGRVAVAGSGLHVAGSYKQDASARLDVDLGSTLKVDNHAALAGTLGLQGIAKGYTPKVGATSSVVHAGSLSGTFTSVDGAALSLVDATLSYTPTDALATLTRVDASILASQFAPDGSPASRVIGQSAANVESAFTVLDAFNTARAGAAADYVGSVAPDVLLRAAALQATASPENFKASLYSLSGAIYGNALTAAALESTRQDTFLSSQFAALSGHRTVFANTGINHSTWTLDGVRASQRTQTQSIGMTTPLTDRWSVGALLSRQRTDWEETLFAGTGPDAARVNAIGFTAAAQFKPDENRYLRGLFSVSFLTNKVNRTLDMGSQSFRSSATQRGESWRATVLAGQRLPVNPRFSVTPEVGVRVGQLRQNGVSESELFGLNVGPSALATTTLLAALRARVNPPWFSNRLSLAASVGVEHDLDSRALSLAGSYTGLPEARISTGSLNFPTTRWNAGAKALLRWSPRTALSFFYQFDYASAWRNHQANLTLTYRF